MSEPTDDQVWAAFDAGQVEARSWRIIDFYKGREVIAVRDLMPLPHDAASADLDITAPAAERHDFKDVITARRYIEWRATKAALSTYAQEIADE